jgi:hypothetical protein
LKKEKVFKMADQNRKDNESATGAARPAAPDLNRGQRPNTESSTDDPFLADMQRIANETILDGNAQINSPQEVVEDEEGSAGNSR